MRKIFHRERNIFLEKVAFRKHLSRVATSPFEIPWCAAGEKFWPIVGPQGHGGGGGTPGLLRGEGAEPRG